MRKLASAFETVTRILFVIVLLIVAGFALLAAAAWIFQIPL